MKNIYVFGNTDLDYDNKAIELAHKISNYVHDINFIYVKTNEDLPFYNNESIVILDVIEGISDIVVIDNMDKVKIMNNLGSSAHDFDLGFQLNYLRKLGKINSIKIIGIPEKSNIDNILEEAKKIIENV